MSKSWKISECAYCGKEFVRKTRGKGGTNQIYCSHVCCLKAQRESKKKLMGQALAIRPLRIEYSKKPSDLISKFVTEASARYPILGPMEERELIAKNVCNRSRLNELLVMHNLKFAMGQAEKWCSTFDSLDGDDIFMLGVGAMWRAAQLFDVNLGIRFASYAGEAVKNAIRAMSCEPEFLRERLSSSLDEAIESRRGYDDGPDRIDVILGKVDPDIYETPLHEWLEHRDMVSFAREILDGALELDRDSMEIFRRWANGETMQSIAEEKSVSHQRIGQRIEKAKRLVKDVRDRAVARYGEKYTCAKMNWDRVASRLCVSRSNPSRVVVEMRGANWLEGYFEFERYKLGQRHEGARHDAGGITYVWKRPQGPRLTSNGFRIRRLKAGDLDFMFVDGKWRPAAKEGAYGY